MTFLDNEKCTYNHSKVSVFPFNECLFSRLGFTRPFNDFKLEIPNHLGISPSRVHPINLTYVQVL